MAIQYGSDILTNGTPTASSVYNDDPTYGADKAIDDNLVTRWGSKTGYPHGWRYDLGAGNAKIVSQLRLNFYAGDVASQIMLYGSNNATDWDELCVEYPADNGNWQTFSFINSTAYRWYHITFLTGHTSNYVAVDEIEMKEMLPPAAPTNCVASYVATNKSKCTWSDTDDNETNFRLEVDINDAGFTFWKNVGANVEDSGNHSTGANKKIRFRVRAYNAVGYSTWATSGYVYTTPTAPTNCAIALGTINVTWTDNSTYEEGFQVERQLDGGGWNLVHTTAAEAESWADASQPTGANVKYEYRVRAKKGTLYSGYSTSNVIFVKSFTEMITLSDTLVKKPAKVFSESIALSDSLVKKPAKVFSESINLSDTYSRIWHIYRSFTETISLTDSLVKKAFKSFSESIHLSDFLIKRPAKIFTEMITLSDTLKKKAYKTFTETVTLADTLKKKATKTFKETINLTDTIRKKVAKIFTEKITLKDSVIKVKSNLVQLWKKLMNLFDIKG